jgi:zinc protease
MSSSITKFTLSNGLLVLLKEIHTAPLISQWMWYRVGSRNESPGMTGAAHWVEHMLFRGTDKFPAGNLDTAIAREGGYWNAMTFKDWTAYFATMPKNKIDLILELEADRMHGIHFTPENVNMERDIIITEREGIEDEPTFILNDEVTMAAFKTHGYRHETVGFKEDLQSITPPQLENFYITHYQPHNAVLSLSGSFDTVEIREKIERLFGTIPDRHNDTNYTEKEESIGEAKSISLSGPGETTFVQISVHAPQATNPDFYPFMVLDSLLSGATSLNMFGGSISNKTSRLYQSLVEENIVISIEGGLVATIDPYMYNIYLTLNLDQSVENALTILDEQILILQTEPSPQIEIDRAIKQAKALFAYGSESITNQAFWLGFSEMFDSYQWFEDYISNLEKVTPKDIQMVAKKYLMPHHRINGIYRPSDEEQTNE